MRNRLSKFLCFSIIFVLLVIAITGCNLFNPVLGTWENSATGSTLEFTSDEHVIYKMGTYLITGSYELIGDDIINVDFEGIGGMLLTTFGGSTWEYTISDGVMTIVAGGVTTTYDKVRK
jgi:hypothetical protein